MEKTRGGLVPAEIYEVDEKGKRKGKLSVSFMFNPHQYTVSLSHSYKAVGNSKIRVELTNVGQQSLSLKRLIFDAYEDDPDKQGVTKQTRELWKLMQPIPAAKSEKSKKKRARPTGRYVAFEWGIFKFVAVITQVSQTFTLFDKEGTPLRAEVDVTFTQYEDRIDYQNPTSRAESSLRVRRVVAGDRLDTIAAEVYDDATKWPLIATYNNIDDPLALRPGQELSIPLE